KFGGIWALVTRTGYTGEDIGFEIFVKHTAAVKFWNLLLTEGKEFGIQPCGLAARDSLRTEAGLPLYGHELNGQHKVSATEAGYGSFIKRHKGFFIGRKAYIDQENKQEKEVARFEIKTPGARLIKPDDPISDKKTGHRVGIVTSCTLVPNLDGQSGGKQVGMVHLDQNLIQEGKSLGVSPTRVKRNKDTGIEEKILLDEVTAEIVSRFPLRQETVDF
ncbi:MAG: aminomethyltransferase family protein, partial [Planctomycetes bacterium]|nr:aminomethyltransferase family protein [Planctomycetota bacterium]